MYLAFIYVYACNTFVCVHSIAFIYVCILLLFTYAYVCSYAFNRLPLYTYTHAFFYRFLLYSIRMRSLRTVVMLQGTQTKERERERDRKGEKFTGGLFGTRRG